MNPRGGASVFEAVQTRTSAFEVFVGSPAACLPSSKKSNNIPRRKEAKKMRRSNEDRIIGLDVHPDSFAGAILLPIRACFWEWTANRTAGLILKDHDGSRPVLVLLKTSGRVIEAA